MTRRRTHIPHPVIEGAPFLVFAAVSLFLVLALIGVAGMRMVGVL